jgi:hypothetical protein
MTLEFVNLRTCYKIEDLIYLEAGPLFHTLNIKE